LLAVADGASLRATSGVNPIRKVVTMLQMMTNKVEEDGKKSKELFDKFMCYCDTAEATLGASIEEASNRIPQLESSIKEGVEQKQQLDDDLVTHKSDRAEATAVIAKTTAIREREAAAFAAESEENKSNLDALSKAIPAIEKGMSGSFLQTGTAAVLRKLTISSNTLTGSDRESLSAFLSVGQGQDQGYAPASGEIVGILKTMNDEMQADLAEIIATENQAITEYEGLVAAKKKEIAAATKAIEEKLQRTGELAVEISKMKNDLEDTSEQLAEDKKFLANLDKTCAAKKAEWAAFEKLHGQELVALADTIKMLNDDDALDLFKKTVASSASSFIQLQASPKMMARQALAFIESARRSSRVHGHKLNLDFVSLALHGRKAGFEKVLQLIDNMVALLKKEQTDDEKKKAYCEAEIDKADDAKKALERQVVDVTKAIDEQAEMIATVTEEIAALKAGVEALDKQVAEASEQRKEENAEFTESLAGNQAAKELIGMAKNRMNKFYNPKMYKAPPKRELTEEERITLNMGGTLAPTNPPAGIAGTGITAFLQISAKTEAAPPPPPAADLSHKKQGAESGGVIQMMDNLMAEIEAEITEMSSEEKAAQQDYEELMKDASEKRALDSKSITEKSGAKAELEADHQSNKELKKAHEVELADTNTVITELHGDCDWLMENFAARKEARTNEIDAMGKAKDVLNGADYSLMQTGVSRRIRRSQ